jgi:hypothetical protein
MGNKPKEKLSDRLTELFLSCVENYTLKDWEHLMEITGLGITMDPSLNLAMVMSEYVMDIIREYKPEDIE